LSVLPEPFRPNFSGIFSHLLGHRTEHQAFTPAPGIRRLITTTHRVTVTVYVHVFHSGQDHLKNIPCQATKMASADIGGCCCKLLAAFGVLPCPNQQSPCVRFRPLLLLA
jgi:hypothetical protein